MTGNSLIDNDKIDRRFLHGIELFNQREFFDCHEVLEELWNDQQEPEKQLTQGIIQIAVGYYHSFKGNYVGANKLFKRGIARVQAFLPESKKLKLDKFLTAVQHDLQLIESQLSSDSSSTQIEYPKLLVPKLERSEN